MMPNSIVHKVPSLLMLSRKAVVKLIRSGHQLEQDDLPISLKRFLYHVLLLWDAYHKNTDL